MPLDVEFLSKKKKKHLEGVLFNAMTAFIL